MISIDLSGKTALITGGTSGIGLASALALGKAGAQSVLTYRWGSNSAESVMERFSMENLPEPIILEADVSREEDTPVLMEAVSRKTDGIDIFISNVGFALKAETLDDYRKKSLYKTFDYSSWPLVDYVRQIKKIFGHYPKTILGISSDGPDHYYRGYDYVAASKSLLEFFVRYLSVHLYDEGCRVNAIRFGTVRTPSFEAIFGEEYFDWMKKNKGLDEKSVLTPSDCAQVVVALCSGLLNPIHGQILNADFGLPFRDNAMMDYLRSRDDTKDGNN